MSKTKAIAVALYMLAIVSANVMTASVAPIQWGALIVPAGSFLIGATFIFRDFVQNAIGRKMTYLVILSAMAVSACRTFPERRTNCSGGSTSKPAPRACRTAAGRGISTG